MHILYEKKVRIGFFTILLIAALLMGIYSCWPEAPKPSGVVLVPVIEQQRELNRRGHNIKEDGIFGKNTDLALTIELSKERK
jgi:hypothetical protein